LTGTNEKPAAGGGAKGEKAKGGNPWDEYAKPGGPAVVEPTRSEPSAEDYKILGAGPGMGGWPEASASPIAKAEQTRPAPNTVSDAAQLQTAERQRNPGGGGGGSYFPTPHSQKPKARPAGETIPGTIDIDNRPAVNNPDGSVSTEHSISIGTHRGEALIPTVVDGKKVTDEEAIQHFFKTDEHLGIFEDAAAATAYAKKLHKRQEKSLSDAEKKRKKK
jgi:hypothetical protein